MQKNAHLMDSEDFNCPICYVTVDEHVFLPCNHSFCEKCIDQALNVFVIFSTKIGESILPNLSKSLLFTNRGELYHKKGEISLRYKLSYIL